MSSMTPVLSVVVPVRNGERALPAVLAALASADLPRNSWELIIVDDASTDDSAEIAAGFADTVLRLSGRARGPAYARNRGFELAHGGIIAFVDADVCIGPDVLRRFLAHFDTDDTLAAVVGSYDSDSAARGLISQYRNLRHYHLRRRNPGEIDFFWPACGAIRREAFVSVGLFDEWHYWRPQVEGAELGQRLRRMGQRIELDPDIQGRHLKHWTMAGMVHTDVRDLGIPWMRLLLQERAVAVARAPALAVSEKLGTATAGCAFASLLMWAFARNPFWVMLAALAGTGTLLAGAPLFAHARRTRGLAFATAIVPIHAVHYLTASWSVVIAWVLHVTVGEPRRDAVDDAFAETELRTWPPVPRRRPQPTSGIAAR